MQDVLKMTAETARELTLKHMNTLRSLGCEELGAAQLFKKADGSRLTDYYGNVHLDCICGVGVSGVGHANPTVKKAVQTCIDEKIFIMAPVAFHDVSAAFAKNTAILSPGGQLTKVLQCTGGPEANEGMLKLVRIACRNKPIKTRLFLVKAVFMAKLSAPFP